MTSDSIFNYYLLGDSASAYPLGFQDPATTTIEGIYLPNPYLLFVIIAIILLVAWIMFLISINFTKLNNSNPANFSHSNTVKTLELVWLSVIILIYDKLTDVTHLVFCELTELCSLNEVKRTKLEEEMLKDLEERFEKRFSIPIGSVILRV